MKRILVVLMAATAWGACKKDSGKPSTEVTKANLVGNYKVTSLKVTFFSQSIEYLDSLPACQRDDIYNLKPDDTYDLVDAGVACDPPSTSSGTWGLDSAVFILDGQRLDIESYDGKNLVVKSKQDYQGQILDANITLTEQ